MTLTTWTQRLAAATLLLALAIGASPEGATACSQCFGTSVNNATTFGISMSMLGLLGFLGVVWGGIGLFVWRVRRRSEMLELEDWVVTKNGELKARDD